MSSIKTMGNCSLIAASSLIFTWSLIFQFDLVQISQSKVLARFDPITSGVVLVLEILQISETLDTCTINHFSNVSWISWILGIRYNLGILKWTNNAIYLPVISFTKNNEPLLWITEDHTMRLDGEASYL